ncbi:hypothetical protein HBI32_142720 [Parastagonospora nodorum]|nr:hypothetical protein HBI32_142720 [Parastagonospora nodorum]
MCAKNDLIRRKSLLSTSTQTPNHVDTFSLDFAFLFAIQKDIAKTSNLSELKANQHFFVYQNILSLIAFIISYRLFADELNIQQSLLDRVTVVLIIILVNKTQLLLILEDIAAYTLLAKFIPTTKIRNPLLKTLKNAAKSRILLAYADGRTRQCYSTIYAILANYEEQVLLTSIKKNRYCMRYTIKHYNFNIHVSLATDTLHLLLKGLVIKMLDFMQDILDDIYSSTIVSLLFISKAPFALHFICAVCNLVTLAQYKKALERINIFKEKFQVYQRTLEEEKNFNYPKALDSIYTRANSKAHYITIVKQFYSITNKKDYMSVQIYSSIKYWRSSGKRHNDPKHCDEEVIRCLHLILIIIDYTCYDKDRKYIAYIRAFSKILLFNNNKQIDNTTRILSILQAFKFYDLSIIICLVHLVPRDLPNLTTYTTISYYVNNYIN